MEALRLIEITTKDSRLLHAASGKSATYGDMASRAVDFDPPANLPLKDSEHLHHCRHTQTRFDIPAKVNGSAIYGVDMRLPDMMFAAIKACPVFGGKLKSFDAKIVSASAA